MKEKVVVILSGGMDSTTLLYDIKNKGYEVYALSVDYNQKHKKELECAEATCKKLKVPFKLIDLSVLNDIAPSALTRDDQDVPEGHYEDENMKQTVVPNRNMVMISLATSYAINIKATKIFYGAHAGDHAIYPDCRPEFVDALSKVIKLADWNEVELIAPYLNIDKGDIAILGRVLKVDYSLTWTCYNPGGRKNNSHWMPNTSKLSEDWIIGYIEGEGSFSRKRQKKGTNGLKEDKYYPSFSITQQDKKILEDIKEFFGFGSVSFQQTTVNGDVYCFSTGGGDVCRKIAIWLNNKLKSDKRKIQFNKWIKAFNLLDYRDLNACGKCGSCQERLEAFEKAGIKDPLEYEE